MVQGFVKMLAASLGGAASNLNEASALSITGGSLWPALWPAAALAGVAMAVGVAANLVQVGAAASAERVTPKWERVSLSEAWRRLWSLRTLQRASVLLVKIAAVGAVAYTTVLASLPSLSAAGRTELAGLFAVAGSMVWSLAWRAGAALVVIGLLDYAYQRWQWRRDLRISHRQLRDDLRQMESPAATKLRRVKQGTSNG